MIYTRMKTYACLAVFILILFGCGSGDKFATDAPGIVVDSKVDFDLSKPVVQSKPVKLETAEKDPSATETSLPKESRVIPTTAEPFPTDRKYLALKRYEVPLKRVLETHDKLERLGEDEIDSLAVAEKNLVLGGRGLDVGGFENRSSDRLFLSSKRQFEGPSVAQPEESRPETLFIGDGMATRDKALVFHSRPGGYFETPKTSGEKEVLPAPDPAMRFTKSISETRLLLAERPDKLIKLHGKKDPMDLLVGHPDINRERYRNPD